MFTEKQIFELVDKTKQLGVSERNVMITIDHIRGCTYTEIALDEGITAERVRQIVCKTYRKVGELFNNPVLSY